MQTSSINRSVLVIGLSIAVALTLFALKSWEKPQVIPQETASEVSPVASTQPSTSQDTRLKKRPAGTEDWLQYVDEKNMVAFLYPSETTVQPREIEQARLNLMLLEPNNRTSHAVSVIIKIYEKDFEKSVSDYTEVMKKNNVKFATTLNKEPAQNFLSQYKIASFEKGVEPDYNFLDYFVSRKFETIYISLDQDNENSNLIFETIILDGTRFQD